MTFGRNGFFTSVRAGAAVSPVTTSWPSCNPSAATAVFAPSEVPAVTSMGRTNAPSFNQSVRWDDFCPLSSLDGWPPGGSLVGGSFELLGRRSGATCASEDGDQRNA